MVKKLVVLNDFSIYPPTHGGKLRIYNIYKELSKRYKVTYICFGESKNTEKTKLSENFLEIKIPKSYFHKTLEKLMGALLGVSVDDIVAMFLCKFNRKINIAVKRYLLDANIIVVSHPYMFPIIKNHKYANDKTLVYELHNVEYLLKKDILEEGYFNKFLCTQVKKIERAASVRADLIFATSTQNIDQLKEIYNIPNTRIYLSPNGVDISAFDVLYNKNNEIIKTKVINPPIAVFLGSGHPPNVEAAKNIAHDIAPKMKEVYFLICGTVCWGIKNEKIGKNIGLTFVVSDEERLELYRISDIALNPMLSGSGTNIKMLDYMAAELPIITTPIGARGLDIENYKHAIVCNVSEFPEKIQEVLKSNEFYNKLSYEGRKLVEEKYDWKKIAENMMEVLMKSHS